MLDDCDDILLGTKVSDAAVRRASVYDDYLIRSGYPVFSNGADGFFQEGSSVVASEHD